MFAMSGTGDTYSYDSEDPLGAKAVGRRVDSTQADDRRMIRLVRERPLLYARNTMPVASYYAQVKRLWQEVAAEMEWSVAEVRRKWSHIRNSYSRHLRNELHGAVTGKGRVVSKWYLADELHFLREHMATDTRPSAYSTYAPNFLDMELGEQAQPAEPPQVDIKPFINNPWFTLATATATATQSKQETTFETPQSHNDDSSSSQPVESEENSVYFQFFKGIYRDYQELSSKKQRLFRRQCLNLLHNLLDEEEERANSVEVEVGQSNAINLSNTSNHNDRDTMPHENIVPN